MSGNVYFASDFHLGVDAACSSRDREHRIVRWLDQIASDALAIYLVGDVFDYWFEYRAVVPKGYNRLLGKLAELRDENVPIYFFTGNHDMWMFRYFEDEFGIPIFREPQIIESSGKRFYIGHGDGLGPGDWGYKTIKRIFSNRTCQWLFARIHPNTGVPIMRFFSQKSRHQNREKATFLGPEKEWLVQFASVYPEDANIDFFVFGHRHLPIDYRLENGRSRYINLGDWLHHYSYAQFDGEDLQVKFFENENGRVFPL